MATNVQQLNQTIAQVATDIGDLMERGDAAATDIVSLQDQINAIDLTSIISNNPAATGTNIGWSVDVITTKLTQLKNEIVAGAPEAYDTLAEVGSEIDLLKGRVDLLEQRTDALEAKYDSNGVLKAEFLPSYVTDGMRFAGTFDPATDTLPTPSAENDGDIYKVSGFGTVATASGNTTVKPGDTLIGDGDSWVAIANQDLVTSVNGKTGNVVLVGADIGYTASLASGLVATDVAAALNEVGAKIKDFMAAYGDPSSLKGVADYLTMRNAAATDGVQPSPVPA